VAAAGESPAPAAAAAANATLHRDLTRVLSDIDQALTAMRRRGL
jgi:hypothetical protein